MKDIELVRDIDREHRLHADVPTELPASKARRIVVLSEEDATGNFWEQGIANEWSGELSDMRQDVYTIEDGSAVNVIR